MTNNQHYDKQGQIMTSNEYSDSNKHYASKETLCPQETAWQQENITIARKHYDLHSDEERKPLQMKHEEALTFGIAEIKGYI